MKQEMLLKRAQSNANFNGAEKPQSEGLQLLIARPQRKTKKKSFYEKVRAVKIKPAEWNETFDEHRVKSLIGCCTFPTAHCSPHLT
jgi:hypothetical protein